jgi:hypothetical protein
MKSQKLKAFEDFLKRAEIIPETLLLITKNNPTCEKALGELRKLNYEIPFYELNLSEHPHLERELSNYYNKDKLPTFVYFRGKNVVSKKDGFEKAFEFSQFIVSSKTHAS